MSGGLFSEKSDEIFGRMSNETSNEMSGRISDEIDLAKCPLGSTGIYRNPLQKAPLKSYSLHTG